jgi:hypothetical protein
MYNTEKFLIIHNLIFIPILNNWNQIIYNPSLIIDNLQIMYNTEKFSIINNLIFVPNLNNHNQII